MTSMPNKFEGGFAARPENKPGQAKPEQIPVEQAKEEPKAAGNIEEAVLKHIAAQPETKVLTPRQQSLENEIKEINARLPELKARQTGLADALRAGFGKDIETVKPRNWLFGMFDNFNKILKEYSELKEEIKIDEDNLRDANFELRDPQGYDKWTKERREATNRLVGRTAGKGSSGPQGFGTLKG